MQSLFASSLSFCSLGQLFRAEGRTCGVPWRGESSKRSLRRCWASGVEWERDGDESLSSPLFGLKVMKETLS